MRERLEEIRKGALEELNEGGDPGRIERVRVRVLGRSGELTDVMRRMREIPADERPAIGQLVNEIKRVLENRIDELQQRAAQEALERSLAEPPFDVTLPGIGIPRGR